MNPNLLYYVAKQAEYKVQNPSITKQSDVMKAISVEYTALPATEKMKWE